MTDLETAYRQHTPALLRYTRRLTGNADQAEEVVAETWTRAIAAWDRFQHLPGADVLDWLYAIAHNCAADLRRRNRRFTWEQLPGDDAAGAPAAVSDTESLAITRDRLALAAAALQRVWPLSQRAALCLAWAGYGSREAAGRLGRTPSAAKALYHRARCSFRAAYAAAGGY